MELHTLRLGAPLSWILGTTALDNATCGLALPVLTQEGSEAVFIWTRDQLVDESDDGPRVCLPLPLPFQTGVSADSVDADPQTHAIVLPTGSYLFCQNRLSDLASIGQTLEWFFREVWWTRAECRDPVYLRLIREDGKTAVQVIMESAKQE